jgi:hypothetical protein
MAARHLRGLLQTETGNQDRRQASWMSDVKWLDPERTAFTAILNRLPSKPVSDPTYKLFEREHKSRWVRLNEALDSSETGVDVDDGKAFRAGDIILCDSERMSVTSISGNTLTVVRGVLGSTAAAHDDDTWVKILYGKQTEGGNSGTPLGVDYSTVENYTQIFREAYGQTGTNAATRKMAGSDLASARALALDSIRRDQEQMAVWGKKQVDRTDGVVTRYSGGIDEFVTSNRIDLEGALEMGDLAYIINVSTRYGSSKKLWFVGRDALYQLSALGLDFVRIDQATKVLGMSVNRVRGPHGEFSLIEHRDFENAHGGRIMIVDPRHVALAVLRKMKHRPNIQTNELDGEKHEFLGELGLWLDTQRAHTICTNAGGEVF